MLPERYRQLLTAYVDGELSARQRRHVERLLLRSPEARRLLEGLQQDSRCLRSLPPNHLDGDLSGPILRTITQRRLSPRRRLPAKAPAGLPAWTGFAAAAAVLVTLGAASFWYFSAHPPGADTSAERDPHPSGLPAVAQRPADPAPADGPANPRPRTGVPPAPERGPVIVHRDPPSPGGGKEKGNPSPQPPKPPDNPVVKAPPDPRLAPPGPAPQPEAPREEGVLTDRMEIFKIDQVTLALPVVLKLHNLDQDSVRQKLVAELGRDRDIRIELPCRNGTRALERLQEAFKAANFGVLIDPLAQARLKLPQVPTNYAIYLEDLTPDELARLLLRIGQDDKKAAARKQPDAQFDGLVLARMGAQDHKELTVLLGIDPTQAAATVPPGPLGTDPRQPLSDRTAKQVSESLAGQGGTPRPEAGKAPARSPEHQILVLAYIPGRPHNHSPEIARFLENRKPARPGTVRLLLVLRG
jgi:hypothetical protein